jgi:predicted RNA-binding Zn ribbon-like protein
MKPALPVVIETEQFTERYFIGGDAALDFVNTVAGRDQVPRDRLDSYTRLLEWAALAQLLPEKILRSLTRKAQQEPQAAAAALTRAKVLREAMFALVTAIASGNTPPKGTLALLREHWVAGVEAHELRFSDGRVVVALRNDATELGLVASMVAYRMVQHVLQQSPKRLRICEGPNCSWLFIDTSKAGRRRWCDMSVCGNAAKSRRFYNKHYRSS